MSATALKYQEERKYTYADYLSWDDDRRWEIINGEVYDTSPAPSDDHQALLLELSKQIAIYLTGKMCVGRIAPYDVRFPEGVKNDEKIIDTVQPDLVIICDRSKIDKRGCQGAPDFIIEILSPSTAAKDLIIKQALYELNKVKEYWAIDPISKVVIVYLLGEDGRYSKPTVHPGKGKLKVTVIEELEIDLDAVFKSPIF